MAGYAILPLTSPTLTAEFLDGAVNLTEPQVKQKIATATEAHLSNKVDANKYATLP